MLETVELLIEAGAGPFLGQTEKDANMEPKQRKPTEPLHASDELADTDGGSNWGRQLNGEERKELSDEVPGLPTSDEDEAEKALVGDDEKEIPREEYEEAISADLTERSERRSFETQAERELADDSSATNEDEEIVSDDTEVEDGPAQPRTRLKPVPNPNSFATKVKQAKKSAPAAAAKASKPAPKKKAAPPAKKKPAPAAKKKSAPDASKKKVAPKKSAAKKVTAKKPAPKKAAAKKKPAPKTRSRK